MRVVGYRAKDFVAGSGPGAAVAGDDFALMKVSYSQHLKEVQTCTEAVETFEQLGPGSVP